MGPRGRYPHDCQVLHIDDFHMGLAEVFAGDTAWAASAMSCYGSHAVLSRIEGLSHPRTKVNTIYPGVSLTGRLRRKPVRFALPT